jgi:hypothetical protein
MVKIHKRLVGKHLYASIDGIWRRCYSDGGKVFGDYVIIKGEKVQI